MRILVPPANFDKTAIPTLCLTFGAEARRTRHRMNLLFLGPSDPLESASPLIARYELPWGDKYNVSRFHPAGVQEGGSVEDRLYGVPTEEELADISRRTGIPVGRL